MDALIRHGDRVSLREIPPSSKVHAAAIGFAGHYLLLAHQDIG
jgi:hypothetical protein